MGDFLLTWEKGAQGVLQCIASASKEEPGSHSLLLQNVKKQVKPLCFFFTAILLFIMGRQDIFPEKSK
jgi:hypothetical protein